MTADTGFSLAEVGSPPLSSAVVGAAGAGGCASPVEAEAASALVAVVTGPAGGLPVGGRVDSSSPEPTAEEASGTKGNDERNSDGTGRDAMPGKLRVGKGGRGGKPRTKMAEIIHSFSTARAAVMSM